jgi:hypothetical protein
MVLRGGAFPETVLENATMEFAPAFAPASTPPSATPPQPLSQTLSTTAFCSVAPIVIASLTPVPSTTPCAVLTRATIRNGSLGKPGPKNPT